MLPKRYDHKTQEIEIISNWAEDETYVFQAGPNDQIYSIDTPPPTVSGMLHLGHIYSYTHPDIFARFWRMRGYRVFYPMGFDDNGLPTERLVEKQLGVRAKTIGRRAFIEKCLELSETMEAEYITLWQRLGLSIDWRYSYRTIDRTSQLISQKSFLELYLNGKVYRREAPTLWCPECQTAIAQAELNDHHRDSEYITINFTLENGEHLPIATTRPELLPACVAIFVHPEDQRFTYAQSHQAKVPLFGHQVPILVDNSADPGKGTGAVMCCTFGDVADVNWWLSYNLPKIEAIDRDGTLTSAAGIFSGFSVSQARHQIKAALLDAGYLLDQQPTRHSIRVHERCDTPVEYITTHQWFIRVLDYKEALLNAGDSIRWYPEQMKSRYVSWVQNLNWDWCISRQRYFGIPIPVWYCQECDQVLLADEQQLPVDPTVEKPQTSCPNCGSQAFSPEEDVLDTWATSSMTPQIVGQWLTNQQMNLESDLYSKVFPFSLRPQAHEIIRTWAFYTIVKSFHHFKTLPWMDVLISGWGIAGEGMGKISKSRGGGPMPPLEMIDRYSADAVRYWAASTAPGKDSVISEEKIQNGAKFATKLWNIARFSASFLNGYIPSQTQSENHGIKNTLTPADKWILSRLQGLIVRTTYLLEQYEYASAKSEIETFLWTEFADNYLEMCKQRLYNTEIPSHQAATYSLHKLLLSVIKLLAPYMPFITEQIYHTVFLPSKRKSSIHLASWPVPEQAFIDTQAEQLGENLVNIATAVRRFKSNLNLPLATELVRLQLFTQNPELLLGLSAAQDDLMSITRAQEIELVSVIDNSLETLLNTELLTVAGAIENNNPPMLNNRKE